MHGGDGRGALEILERFCAEYSAEVMEVFDTNALQASELGELFRLAFAALREHGGSLVLMTRLQQFMLAAGMLVEPLWFVEAAPAVEDRLKQASGYTHWQTLSPDLDPMQRLTLALQHAQHEHDAASDDNRLAPIDAIQQLAQYVVASLAVSMNTCDFERLRALPGLLRPFAPLTPLLQGLMDNMSAVVATVSGDYARAAGLYERVLERMSDQSVAGVEHAQEIRDGVLFGMAVMQSRLGQQQALERLHEIERNPRMRGNCLRLRVVLALQHGDWARADERRQEAEQYGIESAASPIFGQDSLPTEVELYALGHDLGAVKQLLGQIEPLAARYPGWRSVRQLARAEYARLRGDLQGALVALEQCIALCGPRSLGDDPSAPWHHAAASKLEVLLELDRVQDAMTYASELVDEEQPPSVQHHRVLCAVALAEARNGDYDTAMRRLDALIEEHEARGATGIVPGLAHEAAAYCALWAGDEAGYRMHAAAVAAEYHRVSDSGFADRYQRLQRAARRAPISGEISTIMDRDEVRTAVSAATGSLVASALEGHQDRTSRAQRGLGLMCELAGTSSGYLFLLDRAGLQLVASLPGARRGPGLEVFVQAAIEAEAATADPETLTTVLTTDLSAGRPAEPEGWTDRDGRTHHLVRVRAKLGGASSLVGVAVVGAPYARVTSPTVLDCAAALGEFLLRTGNENESAMPRALHTDDLATPKPA